MEQFKHGGRRYYIAEILDEEVWHIESEPLKPTSLIAEYTDKEKAKAHFKQLVPKDAQQVKTMVFIEKWVGKEFYYFLIEEPSHHEFKPTTWRLVIKYIPRKENENAMTYNEACAELKALKERLEKESENLLPF